MSARLPIYRSLNQRLEILGLSLWEMGCLSVLFVGLTEILSFLKWKTVISVGFVLILAGVLRQLNRRFEKNFLLRLIRFGSLPSRLHRMHTIEFRKSPHQRSSKFGIQEKRKVP